MLIEIIKTLLIMNILLIGLKAQGENEPFCDDGKTNLIVDMPDSSDDFKCTDTMLTPNRNIDPYSYCLDKLPIHEVKHLCMNESITYDYLDPFYGNSRVVWPTYGEYGFCPRQRWVHALENGAIVMVYHPCTHVQEIEKLKSLVKQCLRRHLITVVDYKNTDRPLQLLSWLCRLRMSFVDPQRVQQFIVDHALKAPKQIAENGHFDHGIIQQARIVPGSDFYDSNLCPELDH